MRGLSAWRSHATRRARFDHQIYQIATDHQGPLSKRAGFASDLLVQFHLHGHWLDNFHRDRDDDTIHRRD